MLSQYNRLQVVDGIRVARPDVSRMTLADSLRRWRDRYGAIGISLMCVFQNADTLKSDSGSNAASTVSSMSYGTGSAVSPVVRTPDARIPAAWERPSRELDIERRDF